MISFSKRCLNLFFKDKSNLFFSLLAVFIIVGLYVLFLGDMIVQGMENMPKARYLMDSWMMAGLLSVVPVTTTMGAFGTMVNDRSAKIVKDFTCSPAKRTNIVGGYIISSFIIGILMSVVSFILIEIYVVAEGGEFVSALTLVKTTGLILLSTFSNMSIVLFITSFFSSINAFATASTILGTMIGFITGIYIPVGTLPGAIQWVIKLFPVSHSASLFRQVLMQRPISLTFAGAPADTISEFEQSMGIIFKFGKFEAGPIINIVVLIFTAVLFYSLSVLNICRKQK